MYESLTDCLKTSSADSPFLWALMVMGVIASAGLLLYVFWEIVLRGLGLAFGGRGSRRHDSGLKSGGH